MKKKIFSIIAVLVFAVIVMAGCSQAETVKNNLQKDADRFDVYRKMTFINLYTNDVLYSVEGYFSLQTTYSNEYRGQQEVGIVIKVNHDQYQMHYFSIANNVTYVIEQLENTTTNPYNWNIVWYIPIPVIV